MNKAILDRMLKFEDMLVSEVDVDFENSVLNVELSYKTTNCDCESCGGEGSAREIKRESRKHPVRHLDCFDFKTLLRFDNIEMKCPSCGSMFNRRPSFLGDSHFVTLSILDDWMVKAKGTSLKTVAEWSGESDRTFTEMYFRELSKADADRILQPVVRLGLDEISLLKGHGNYVLLMYDLDRHEIIEVLPDRKKDTLIAYLTEHREDVFSALEVVSIDMWRHYRDAVNAVFRHVDIVADRFHVIKELNESLDACRRSIQKRIKDADERKEWKKKAKAILLRSFENQIQRPEGVAELEAVLSFDPELRKAYRLKEQFRQIYLLDDYQEARSALNRWIRRAAYANSEFLMPFVGTVKRWKTEILGYVKHRVTNGISEGFNCKVKLVKRISYGIRNFVNFRLRILHTCSQTLNS